MQQSQQLDRVFAALANPVRRAIMQTIVDGERTVVELAAPHEMSLNAVSKHIKCLERAGLVRRQVDGSYHRISIDKAALDNAAHWLSHYVPFWSDTLRKLKTYVESK